MAALRVVLLMIAAAGCGSLGGAGGGAANLPVSGSGPFRPLDPSDPTWSSLNAPIVLQDSGADLDSPFVLARGDQLTVWLTATRMQVTAIERADASKLEVGFGDPSPVLAADQPWEQGAVSSPSLIPGDPMVPAGKWLLFYGAGGAIGFATSVVGDRWIKSSRATLTANGDEEGGQLSSPAAVRIGDRLRVYYVAEGAVWAAETSYDDVAAMRAVTWTRLDGDTTSTKRDPIIRAPAWAKTLTGVSARVTETPAGRLRHDLYFTASMAAYMMKTGASGCGFASSYSGADFATAAAPIIPLGQATRAPSETPYRAEALLLFIEQSGARQAVAAATSP
jgi:hypothetical protein